MSARTARELLRADGGPILAPSILSADFARLGEEIADVTAAGADWIHVDVMDGRFVPNLTIGVPVVKALRKITALPLDVHLMIVEPERWIEPFASAGADVITVHAEATPHLHRALQAIRAAGCVAGVSLNPSTPEETLRVVLAGGLVDLVLVMSVNPGFGGQSFLPEVLPKTKVLRRWIDEAKLPTIVEIDGGIAEGTAGQASAAGARAFVAGNAVFGAGKARYAHAVSSLRAEAAAALGGSK